MDTTKYTVEKMTQIWNDKTGERIEFGPDRDGLDLVEIRFVTDTGKIGERITMTEEQAVLLAHEIIKEYGNK